MSLQVRRDVFQAIADPTRRGIINLVAQRPMNLNSIAENFDISRSAVSQQIKILTECGIIIIKQKGRERYCEANLQQLIQVSDWVAHNCKIWEGRFNAIENLLGEMEAPSKPKRKNK